MWLYSAFGGMRSRRGLWRVPMPTLAIMGLLLFFANAIGQTHPGAAMLLLLFAIAFPLIRRAARWFFEGLFIGWGVRESGVLNRLAGPPRRRPYNERAIRHERSEPAPMPRIRGFSPEQVAELQRRFPDVDFGE